jgi:hypothetical protein
MHANEIKQGIVKQNEGGVDEYRYVRLFNRRLYKNCWYIFKGWLGKGRSKDYSQLVYWQVV